MPRRFNPRRDDWNGDDADDPGGRGDGRDFSPRGDGGARRRDPRDFDDDSDDDLTDDFDDPHGPDDFDDPDGAYADDWDDEPTEPCHACGREFHEDSQRCPHCGQWRQEANNSLWAGRPWWWVVLGGLGLLAAVGAMALTF